MTQEDNDSIEASIRGKKENDSSVASRIAVAQHSLQIVWVSGSVLIVLVGSIIAVALWANSIRGDIDTLKKRGDAADKTFTERNSRIEALEKYAAQNDRVLDSQSEITKANRKDLDVLVARVNKIEPDVQDMAFMRDHGISNKENFLQRHGFSAPGETTSETNPKR